MKLPLKYDCMPDTPLDRLKALFTDYGTFGMAVKLEYWGQGIGSRLLQSMEAHARTTEISRIEAEVRASNDSGISLYQKNGFKIEGTREKAAFLNGIFEDELSIAKCL
jgi:ribosomal protein S18 acetylase RimI-like enzyme